MNIPAESSKTAQPHSKTAGNSHKNKKIPVNFFTEKTKKSALCGNRGRINRGIMVICMTHIPDTITIISISPFPYIVKGSEKYVMHQMS